MPPSALLADVFRQLPFLVIHTTTDGTVLHCNPETTRVTGYEERELLGKNIWGILFPGKLFAQVPKFISLLAPLVLLKDIPMTIRTKAGKERIIAFSRYSHGGIEAGHTASEPRSFICVGVDLTDRLLDSDREKLPPSYSTGSDASGEFMAFGPHIGNAGAIDGEFVTPIAISPMLPRHNPEDGPSSVEKAREALARVETHMGCVQGALADGETKMIAALETAAQNPALLEAIDFIAGGTWLTSEVNGPPMGVIRARVDELRTLYRPEKS